MSKILVLMDHAEGGVNSASWDALAMGQRLAADAGSGLQAVVLGSDLQVIAGEVASKKADSVLRIEDRLLSEYDPDLYCGALTQVVSAVQPEVLVMAHTYQNIDLAPRLAVVLRTALVTDCVGYRRDDQQTVFVRQMFRNKINAEVRLVSAFPWLVMVQSGAYAAEGVLSGHCAVEDFKVDLSASRPRRQSLEKVAASGKGAVDLSKAEVIVGVGRGIKSAENLNMMEELAEVLKAELGASRPVVDNEWMDRSRQIGSSGQNVAPKLYLACGISGAIQHVVGIKGSRCSVAINTDPHAPIFNVVDYGIVGDLLEVVPVLTRKLKEAGLG